MIRIDGPVVSRSVGAPPARLAAFNRSDNRRPNERVRAGVATRKTSARHVRRIGYVAPRHGDRFETAFVLSGVAWILAWEWLNPHRASLCSWPRGQTWRRTHAGASRP